MTEEDFIKVLEYPRGKPWDFALSNYEVTEAKNENGIIKANVTYNNNNSWLKLPNLNITKVEIKNSNVYYAYLGVWQVTNLDNQETARKNKITSFKAVNCPNLKYLFLGDNKLTEIDITTIPSLININCVDNDISDIDISNNPNIKTLFFVRNRFTTIAIDRILQELINRNAQNCFVSFREQKTGQSGTPSLVSQFLALSSTNFFD